MTPPAVSKPNENSDVEEEKSESFSEESLPDKMAAWTWHRTQQLHPVDGLAGLPVEESANKSWILGIR